ncbi:MAG: hypothetical protein ABFS02_07430 [Pseudomonadota bacterium]
MTRNIHCLRLRLSEADLVRTKDADIYARTGAETEARRIRREIESLTETPSLLGGGHRRG